MTRTEALWARLSAGEVLLSDGPTGTLLLSMGMPSGQSPEVWVIEQPDQIRALHRGYIEAGSDLILTCTFGGTRFRLSGHDLADRVVEVNRRAAELARAEAGSAVFVAGDMGPTGKLLKPLGPLSTEEVANAYAEQATGLVEGGVDFLLVETMSDLGEAQAAIEGARRVADIPIVCTFSFDTHGRTMMGLKPATVAERIEEMYTARHHGLNRITAIVAGEGNRSICRTVIGAIARQNLVAARVKTSDFDRIFIGFRASQSVEGFLEFPGSNLSQFLSE